MIIFKRVSELNKYLVGQKGKKKCIGFIPTMGALHEGHLSLVKKSKLENLITVVSIFVNPTQFNDSKDLEKYPRPIENDIYLLSKSNCDILFLPDVTEIYPKDLDTTVDIELGLLDTVLEGEFRPGHFDGMTQVVNRLLNIVEPNRLYMGQKDFQQFSVVRTMLNILKSNVELIVCETLREEDGLAMSSRNVRLTPEYRNKAKILYQSLNFAKENLRKLAFADIENECKAMITKEGGKVEYVSIVKGGTLETMSNYEPNEEIVILLATWMGEVRLIDNMILQEAKKSIN